MFNLRTNLELYKWNHPFLQSFLFLRRFRQLFGFFVGVISSVFLLGVVEHSRKFSKLLRAFSLSTHLFLFYVLSTNRHYSFILLLSIIDLSSFFHGLFLFCLFLDIFLILCVSHFKLLCSPLLLFPCSVFSFCLRSFGPAY